MAIEGIKGIRAGENPILTGFEKRKKLEENYAGIFAGALTGIQNTANYVRGGGDIFTQAKDTAATSM